MSYSSRSSRGGHYRHGHHGSGHYKKKSLFGSMFELFGSGSGRRHNMTYHDHPAEHPQRNQHPGTHQTVSHAGTTTCGSCHAQIPAGSKFCLQCGQKVNTSAFCTNCGESLPPNAKFCLNCGQKVT